MARRAEPKSSGERGRGEHGHAASGDQAIEGLVDVGHPVGDVADAVAVSGHVVGHLGAVVEGGGEDEAEVALLDDVGLTVGHAGLGPGVGHDLEAEGGGPEVGGVAGIADPPLEVIEAQELRCGDCGGG